jgi:hypothetical protein
MRARRNPRQNCIRLISAGTLALTQHNRGNTFSSRNTRLGYSPDYTAVKFDEKNGINTTRKSFFPIFIALLWYLANRGVRMHTNYSYLHNIHSRIFSDSLNTRSQAKLALSHLRGIACFSTFIQLVTLQKLFIRTDYSWVSFATLNKCHKNWNEPKHYGNVLSVNNEPLLYEWYQTLYSH